jgi:hypothetical protein
LKKNKNEGGKTKWVRKGIIINIRPSNG